MSDRAPRRRAPVIAIVAIVLLAIPVTAWLLRGTIATSIARGELQERGLSCDDRFFVDVGATFGSATIGPTRCTREGGIVEAVELLGPMTVELAGTEPEQVTVESMRVELTEAEVRNGSGWAPALRRLNLEQRVAGLIKGLSELSGMELPPTTVGQLEVTRGGGQIATAEALTLTPGEPMDVVARRITFTAGPMGVGRLELTEVRGTASRPRVELSGQATARAGIALLGTISTGGRFTIDASGLDGARPRFVLGGSFR